MHIHAQTNAYPYSVAQLKRDNPQTSFPSQISDQLLESWGVYRVVDQNQPIVDPLTHRVVEAHPEQVNGIWTQQWRIDPLSQEEIDSAQKSLAESVRAERNALLAACDWTQLADAPVDRSVWEYYRQSLRDLPSQAGFPSNVQWPSKP
jgi:hypothetical protein